MTLAAAPPAVARGRLLPALDHPADALQNLGPNWFATVMGTGIIANAAVILPVQVSGQRAFALGVWLLALVLLAVLIAAIATAWLRHPGQAQAHLSHPVMSHFFGAPAMAMLTVGAGAVLVGRDVIGMRAAVDLDWVLWSVGTLTGLLTAVAIPWLAFTRHAYKPESAFGGWLMPIVPPMVSASTGALLIPHAAAGQARETLLLGCYVMFGLSLFTSFIVITLLWSRLLHHGLGDSSAIPTLWIVLGPLGQSITAAGLLGDAARTVLPGPYAGGAAALALFYGLATWGFAILWFSIASAITVRTMRQHLPFSLAWWSFTFPVGTVVTGTSSLAARTGLDALVIAATALFVSLLLAWGTVLVKTALGASRGHLFLPQTAQP